MLQILAFIFKYIADFIKMLFTIDVDNMLSIGSMFCICFIFLPMMLRVFNFLKQYATDAIADEIADEKRQNERIKRRYR